MEVIFTYKKMKLLGHEGTCQTIVFLASGSGCYSTIGNKIELQIHLTKVEPILSFEEN